MMPNSVQATRGCKRACTLLGSSVWPRYLNARADVVADVTSCAATICINDVSLVTIWTMPASFSPP